MGHRIRNQSLHSFQHVMARGINRGLIFVSESDYATYLRFLEIYSARYRSRVLAYCLMPNHVHLLIKANGDMSDFIRDIHAAYGRYFNLRNGRVGHVFQSRFRSRPIADNAYLLEAGRYIHMNPVVANLAHVPAEYSWSSMRYYSGNEPPRWLDTNFLLMPFSGDRRLLMDFTIGIPVCSNAVKRDSTGTDSDASLRNPPSIKLILEPRSILAKVAFVLGVHVDALLTGGRGMRPYGARALALMAVIQNSEMRLNEAAALLGYRSVVSALNSMKSLKLRRRTMEDYRDRLLSVEIPV